MPTTPNRQVTSAPRTPRGVTFAEPFVNYSHDLDDLLDLSSSSDESENATIHPSRDLRPSLSGDDARLDVEVTARPTYLEYIDYKALMASLRTLNQHDTAHHLMTVATLKRLPVDQYRDIATRPVRRGWTAWPLPPAETRHAQRSKRACTDTLKAEITAQLHRTLTTRLRAEGHVVSADDLPDSVSHAVSQTVLDKVTNLLRGLATLRTSQAGPAQSTLHRMNLMTHHDVLTVLRHADLVSESDLARIEDKCRQLFGDTAQPLSTEQTVPATEQMSSATEQTRPATTQTSPVEYPQTGPVFPRASSAPAHAERHAGGKVELTDDGVQIGSGAWSSRGTKRRRITALSPTNASRDNSMNEHGRDEQVRARYRVTNDPGTRFGKDTRLVPAHSIKGES